MSAAEEQSGLAREVAMHAAHRVADAALRRYATSLLAKAGAVAGAKVIAVGAVVLLLVCVLVVLVGAIGVAFQQTTAPWPVRPDVLPDGTYRAGGWAISSRYGWRDNSLTGAAEFHDGIDIVSPDGRCPFGYRCELPSMFDGVVTYVGWDQSGADDPADAGGGQIVIIENGDADHEVLYAHLEPYRLHVQLQGRIIDDYGRYDEYHDYQPIGVGELTPDLGDGAIEMWCVSDMPGFRPTRTGAGTVTFAYDRPAQCHTTVVWGRRGDDWNGWIADDPPADREGRATLAWQTPLQGERSDRRAGDVALRFRAHLVPPPPPPTPTPTVVAPAEPAPDNTGSAGAHPRVARAGQGGLGQGWNLPSSSARRLGQPRMCQDEALGMRCVWALSDIPTEAERMVVGQSFAPTASQRPGARSAQGGPALFQEASTPTATTVPVPSLVLVMSSQPALVPVGGRFQVAVSLFSGTRMAEEHTVSVEGEQGLAVLDAVASNGACTSGTAGATCRVVAYDGAPATLWLTYDVLPGEPETYRRTVRASVANGERRTSAQRLIAVDRYAITPAPWPPPTQLPTPALATPSPAAYPPPGHSVPSPVLPIAPSLPGSPGGPPSSPLQCASQALVPLSGVVNAAGSSSNVRLAEGAASSFQAVRAEIVAATGTDPLARLADALRTPEFRSTKPGVARMSWHMAGRAIDLDQGGPWRVVREGALYRVWLATIDITAIFERYGWRRIAPVDGVSEWWHYEYRPEGINWASAMLQVWPIGRLQAAFPEVAWGSVGCQQGTPPPSAPLPDSDVCVPGVPSFGSAIEELPGCGPPVRPGDQVYQLETPLGFVGLTGQTTGPHLHLGLRVKSYDGMVHQTDICTPAWLGGRVAPLDAGCWTEMADPLSFLPLAPAPQLESGASARGATPAAVIPEGAPYQLPPPGYPGSLAYEPAPGERPSGQYWSPYQDGGQYGGGGFLTWLRESTCPAWQGFPWCAP